MEIVDNIAACVAPVDEGALRQIGTTTMPWQIP